MPDIATWRSSWHQSQYTRGQFTPVLSYQEQIFSKIERLQQIGDQPVSRRFEPSSRTFLISEQLNPWQFLHHQDKMSRHRCRLLLEKTNISRIFCYQKDRTISSSRVALLRAKWENGVQSLRVSRLFKSWIFPRYCPHEMCKAHASVESTVIANYFLQEITFLGTPM